MDALIKDEIGARFHKQEQSPPNNTYFNYKLGLFIIITISISILVYYRYKIFPNIETIIPSNNVNNNNTNTDPFFTPLA